MKTKALSSVIFHSTIALLLFAGPCFGILPAPEGGSKAAKPVTKKNTVKMTTQCAKTLTNINRKITALERQLKTCNADKPAKECLPLSRELSSTKQLLKSSTRICSFQRLFTSPAFSYLNRGSDKITGVNMKNARFGTVSSLGMGGLSAKPQAAAKPAPLPSAAKPTEKAAADKPAAKSLFGVFLSRVVEGGKSLLNIGKGIVSDVVGTIKDVTVGLVKDVANAGKNLLKGNFAEAAKGLIKAPLNAVGRTAGGVVDSLAKIVLGGVDIIDTTLLGKPLPRKLTAEERKLLDSVYKGSVNLDAIRIYQDSTSHIALPSHAVGNNIYFKDKIGPLYNADGSLTWEGQTLVHETSHVWQNQHGGGDYLHKAMFANVVAAVTQGDRNKAYEWKPQAAAGVPFSELNPEQQGTVIDNLAADDLLPEGQKQLTAVETEYARKAMELVLAGKGAP